ncbi:MAG: FAD-binding protein [Thermoleophilia bacterium]|nr:FAD-binding protein [Thermoleophilia bacterium]
MQSASEVLRPASLQEASDALAAASTSGRTLRIGETLLTDRLNRVLQHEAGDLTCTVEAGIRLSELRAVLAPHGQRLSLDPPGDPTVGACLAASLSGPLRHRFGGPRDLVLGVTLVLGDGTVANAGGTVVKNVAGYDLGKLVCGSRGTLALIARVSLRLHPVQSAAATLVVETGDAAGVAHALLRSQLQPSALDVLHPGRVLVLFEGVEPAVDAQLAAARALVGGAAGDEDAWAESRERQGAALGRLRFAPRDLRNTLSTLREAIVRPAVGVAYVPNRVGGVPPAGVRRLERGLKAAFDPAGALA